MDSILELIVTLGKYVLILPAFILKIIEFLFVMISFIPNPFRTITLCFLPFYIGIFVLKLKGKAS